MPTVRFMHPYTTADGKRKSLPPAVKDLATKAAGTEGDLDDFAARLREAAPGGEVSVSPDFVGLLIRHDDGRADSFRVIRYEAATEPAAATSPAPPPAAARPSE